MPNRTAKDPRSTLETWPIATRYMPNRNHMARFWPFDSTKTHISFSISSKIPTQLSNQKT